MATVCCMARSVHVRGPVTMQHLIHTELHRRDGPSGRQRLSTHHTRGPAWECTQTSSPQDHIFTGPLTSLQVRDPSLLRFLVDVRDADPSDKQLRDDLMTMLIAGHETTAAVLTWCATLAHLQPSHLCSCVRPHGVSRLRACQNCA